MSKGDVVIVKSACHIQAILKTFTSVFVSALVSVAGE